MTTPQLSRAGTQHPARKKMRQTYGEYLDGLFAEMERRPSLLWLAHYLLYYGSRDRFPHFTERDATPPDLKAIEAAGYDWTWPRRQWLSRERARRIIEGREPWPRRLLGWKHFMELRYYHGSLAQVPGWLDSRNWPDPTTPPEYTRADLTADLLKAAWAHPKSKKRKAAQCAGAR
ncbi:MAG: hypothetical protein BroJett013_19620 [Alphaproteobacteria bacterium]|nr:MAG: hypothetical protein BroJett013_19620 [Alphaproteobacteria bacterium]